MSSEWTKVGQLKEGILTLECEFKFFNELMRKIETGGGAEAAGGSCEDACVDHGGVEHCYGGGKIAVCGDGTVWAV